MALVGALGVVAAGLCWPIVSYDDKGAATG